MADPVLTISGLTTHFFVPGGVVKAVDGVDLAIEREQIVTVVGESGSGKSVTALSIMRLIQAPGRILHGEVWFGGKNLLTLSAREMQALRGDRIAMIFQNPYTSLHPHYRIGRQMIEPILLRSNINDNEARRRVIDMLARIGIDDGHTILRRYPFEVSAGICQRVMLAMALMSRPQLLIADEPTTNLDALAQVQILELIKRMRDEFHMSVLLITHDFGVVSMMADRVVVMYAGKQVETGGAETVLDAPRHPYSIGLIDSVPVPGERVDWLQQIPGDVPDVMRLAPGCSFRPRCPRAMQVCRRDPPLVAVDDAHLARCWLFTEH